MPFKNDREFWIFVESVLHTSQMAKSLEPKQITALAEYIRSQNCPQLSYDDWLDIEKSIIDSKYVIMGSLASGLTQALGGTTSNKAFEEIRNLDSGFRDTVANIDLEDIERKLKESKITIPDLTKVLDLAKSYQKEKKEFKKI
ncbi:MAG TPA: hypothetical protein VJJ25_04435 [Nitrosopumilaceae archaeon]|nr:hypothetical protein [Nitrosopumilaceae archaeon]